MKIKSYSSPFQGTICQEHRCPREIRATRTASTGDLIIDFLMDQRRYEIEITVEEAKRLRADIDRYILKLTKERADG